MSRPLVTIGITSYNAAYTIERAIRSAKNQSWPNTEVLVVDDCSSDGSRAIIDGTAGIRKIYPPQNGGPGASRKLLVEGAQGDFLVFFDDDDESHPDRVAKQVQRLQEFEQTHPGALAACYASGKRVYSNGYEINIHAIGCSAVEPHGPNVADRILYFGAAQPGWDYGATASCSLMARTATFRKVGSFDPNFRRVEDLDFAVRLALAGGYFIGCPEILFTQHATTGSDKTAEKNLEAELKLIHKHSNYLRTQGLADYAEDWTRLRYYHFTKQRVRFIATLARLLRKHPTRTANHLIIAAPRRWIHERRQRK